MFFKTISIKKVILPIIIIILFIIMISFIIIKNNIVDNKKQTQNVDTNQTETLDTTPPIIILGDTYIIKKGYEKNLVEVIMSADDEDKNPTREIIGEYDVNTVGEYNLTYKIEDISGNVTTKDFILKVRDNYTYSEDDIFLKDAIAKYKTETTKIGIDVSKWQGEIDWEKVAKEGVEFVILRMGYQNGFDGELLIDPYFEQNLEGCKKNNLPIAVYLSSYAKTVQESQEQANWICQKLEEYNCQEITIAFDWENWSSFNKLSLSLTDINNMADIFMNQCEKLGYKSILYSSKTYLEEVWKNLNNYPVWLAHYVEQTTYEGSYKLWQFCQTGIIDGIDGYVDINVMY